MLWSLTSGGAGEFVGSDDWEFHDGWEQRLSTRALTQIGRVRSLFSTLPWWRLVPDTGAGTWLLPRLVGVQTAMKLLMSGDFWSAQEAFEAGIFAKRLGTSQEAREIAPTQSSGESGSVASFDPTWRPLPR